MSKQFRAVIFGCGMIGGLGDSPGDDKIITHAHAYENNDKFNLTACCDKEQDILDRFKQKWGAHLRDYTNFHNLIQNEEFEVASVASDTAIHAEILKELFEKNSLKLILCEKPFLASLEELDDIKEAIDHHPEKSILINFSRRYDPGFQNLADRIAGGAMGKPHYFSGVFTKGLYHNGCHMFELLETFFGPTMAVTANKNSLIGDDNFGRYHVEMDRCGGHLANLSSDNYSMFEIDLLFDKGRIRIAESGHRLEIHTPKNSNIYSGYRYLADDVAVDDSMVQSMAHFLKYGQTAIEDGFDRIKTIFEDHLALTERMLTLKERLESGEKKIIFD
jgi:predicted dehydrogenase